MIPQGVFNQSSKIVTSIFLSHSGTINLNQGSTYQFTVTATWSDGTSSDVTNLATYHSSYTERVTVNSTGLATASSINTGATTIMVDYEGASVWLNINVVAYVMSLYVTPGSTNLPQGRTQQITTYANWSDGTQTNVTSSASYTRTNTRISVTSGGLVTAVTIGASGVNISYGGHSAAVTITVTAAVVTSISISPSSISMAAGATRQLTVTAHYSNGSTANVTSSASYGTSNSSRATVNSSGLVTAGSSTGSVNITATYGGWSNSTSVNVTAPTVTSLSISPTSFSIAQGKTQQLAVTAHMSNGSTQTVTGSASYSSSSTGRATVNGSGLVTASNSNTGTVNITASYGGKSVVSSGTITAATVESITVSPTSVSLPMGRTQQLTVTAHLSNGGTQTVTSSASYSSNNTGRATVSGGGLITAGNTTGAATITITYSGKSTTMTSTTTAAVVDNLSVSPTSASIEVGNTRQLTVTATMSNGTNQNVTSSATYTRSNSNITVSSGGLVTATSAGSSSVSISYGGKSTSSSFTITAPAPTLVSFSISPNGGYISGTNVINISVMGTFSDSSTRALLPSEISWTLDLHTHIDIVNIMPRVTPLGSAWWYAYLEGPPYPTVGNTTYMVSYTGSQGSPSSKFVTFTVG